MFRRSSRLRYREEDARYWLRWLARSLRRSGHSEFYLEQLQPSWLKSRAHRFAYVLVSRVMQGLAVGLLFTSIFAAMDTKRAALEAEEEVSAATPEEDVASGSQFERGWQRLKHVYSGLMAAVGGESGIAEDEAEQAGSAEDDLQSPEPGEQADLAPHDSPTDPGSAMVGPAGDADSLQEDAPGDVDDEDPFARVQAELERARWERRLTHLYWGLVAGLALGLFDYFRLSNKGVWNWINFPTLPQRLSQWGTRAARDVLTELLFVAVWAKRRYRHRFPSLGRLPRIIDDTIESTHGVLEYALRYLLVWVTTWTVAGLAVAVFVLPHIDNTEVVADEHGAADILVQAVRFELAKIPDVLGPVLALLWFMLPEFPLEMVLVPGHAYSQRTLLALFVMIFGFISAKTVGRVWTNDIECVETLGQSWGHGTVGALLGGFGGACVALVFGEGFFVVLVGAITGAAFHGLKTSVRELRSKPNQGIVLSAKHAVTYGSALGLICGFLWGYSIWWELDVGTTDLRKPLACAVTGAIVLVLGRSFVRSLLRRWMRYRGLRRIPNRALVFYGGMGGLFTGALMAWWSEPLVVWGTLCAFIALALTSAIWFGGLELIRHQTLRTILYVSDYTPLRYVPFLDYAANQLAFLEKVGGGYMFIHRYLLEHFSEMSPDVVITRFATHSDQGGLSRHKGLLDRDLARDDVLRLEDGGHREANDEREADQDRAAELD